MSYSGCALTLPLESEFEEGLSYADVILLNVESEDQKPAKLFEGQPMIHQNKPRQFSRAKFIWIIVRWHFIVFLAITTLIYAAFHYGLHKNQKQEILKTLTVFADWRQMAFFLGIYISFAVKKTQDIVSVRSE